MRSSGASSAALGTRTSLGAFTQPQVIRFPVIPGRRSRSPESIPTGRTDPHGPGSWIPGSAFGRPGMTQQDGPPTRRPRLRVFGLGRRNALILLRPTAATISRGKAVARLVAAYCENRTIDVGFTYRLHPRHAPRWSAARPAPFCEMQNELIWETAMESTIRQASTGLRAGHSVIWRNKPNRAPRSDAQAIWRNKATDRRTSAAPHHL
jgi:hypothetical protein